MHTVLRAVAHERQVVASVGIQAAQLAPLLVQARRLESARAVQVDEVGRLAVMVQLLVVLLRVVRVGVHGRVVPVLEVVVERLVVQGRVLVVSWEVRRRKFGPGGRVREWRRRRVSH